MTLDETIKRYGGVGPGFHFIRHALAIVIFLQHTRHITIDYTKLTSPVVQGVVAQASFAPKLSVSTLFQPILFSLVAAFFAVSGFLVTGSALRNPDVRTFFANRAFRILPALSVEVTLSAIVLGPLVTVLPLGLYFADPQLFRYFGNIFGFVTYTLPGVFESNPWAGIVNANLWTLPPEFWCYFSMLGLMLGGLLKRGRMVLIIAGLAAVLWSGLDLYDHATFSIKHDDTHFTTWYIVLMFFFGSAIYMNSDMIKMSPTIFIVCFSLYYLSLLTGILLPMSGIFLTYVIIYIGFQPFRWFDNTIKSDISYGIYLYGFPIAQTVTFFLLPHIKDQSNIIKIGLIASLSLSITAAFAAVSWKYIEKPTLALRKKFSLRPETHSS